MRILQLLGFIILAACANSDKKPENVIEQQKMADILTEIHLLEAKVGQLYLAKDSTERLYRKLERELFAKYEVDSLTYIESLDYYSANPAEFLEVYEGVVDSLMVREKQKRIE
jgi:hypothetical protein